MSSTYIDLKNKYIELIYWGYNLNPNGVFPELFSQRVSVYNGIGVERHNKYVLNVTLLLINTNKGYN